MADMLPLAAEIRRKSIHLSTTIIPLLYYAGVDRELILYFCVFLTIGFLLADVLRMNFDLAEQYFLRIFSKLLRVDERSRKLTGATYLFLGMTAAIFLFPKEAAVPAVMFLTLADPMAAIVGKRWGDDEFFNKSIEGALAFYLTASGIVLIFTAYSWAGLGVALATAIVELLPIGINDNILIPMVSGYLLMVLL